MIHCTYNTGEKKMVRSSKGSDVTYIVLEDTWNKPKEKKMPVTAIQRVATQKQKVRWARKIWEVFNLAIKKGIHELIHFMKLYHHILFCLTRISLYQIRAPINLNLVLITQRSASKIPTLSSWELPGNFYVYSLIISPKLSNLGLQGGTN